MIAKEEGAGTTPATALLESSGGAGHGGPGGNSADFSGGASYGSTTQPTSIGSGGSEAFFDPGGAGGSAIHLDITNTLEVSGKIIMDGIVSVGEFLSDGAAGGGSGGSIWLQCETFTGEDIGTIDV